MQVLCTYSTIPNRISNYQQNQTAMGTVTVNADVRFENLADC